MHVKIAEKSRELLNELTMTQEAATHRRAIYAVLDPSRDNTLPAVAAGLADEARCLFLGAALDEFGDSSPWLVKLDYEGAFLDHVIVNGGTRACIFLISEEPFNAIFNHVRKFTKIIDADGDEIFWRFYDPFILSTQIPFLSKEQRIHFFSNIEFYCAEMGDSAFVALQPNSDGTLNSIVLECLDDSVNRSENQISLVEDIPEGLVSIDVDGSAVRPLMRFTQSQIDGPLIYNRPRLVAEVIENIDEDFEPVISSLDDQAVTQMVGHGISLAIGYGFNDVAHIELFVDLMFRIAPGWHRQPAINTVLNTPNLSAQEKMRRISGDGYQSAWEDAEQLDDPREWLPNEIAKDLGPDGGLLQ